MEDEARVKKRGAIELKAWKRRGAEELQRAGLPVLSIIWRILLVVN